MDCTYARVSSIGPTRWVQCLKIVSLGIKKGAYRGKGQLAHKIKITNVQLIYLSLQSMLPIRRYGRVSIHCSIQLLQMSTYTIREIGRGGVKDKWWDDRKESRKWDHRLCASVFGYGVRKYVLTQMHPSQKIPHVSAFTTELMYLLSIYCLCSHCSVTSTYYNVLIPSFVFLQMQRFNRSRTSTRFISLGKPRHDKK